MKFWNTNICLTSRKITLLIVVVLLSTLVLASVWTTPLEEIIEEVATTRVTERGGRADDKRSEAAMEDRKKEGYF